MGRYPTKAAGNRYYESRKNAAEHDERLTSREAAGELLGVSWSSLADYERGLTKVPVDVVCRMADLYKDPSLLNWYCCKECPICRNDQLATEMDDIRGIALRLLVDGDTDTITQEIAEIAKDGIIRKQRGRRCRRPCGSWRRSASSSANSSSIARSISMRMTAMSRIEELWEILKEYGIKTPEQFMEAYRRCPKIDITPFVAAEGGGIAEEDTVAPAS